MFNDERLIRIIELIESQGRVEVNDLSQRFEVSLDTVRRDLKKLEGQGHLKRTHGGAVSIKPVGNAMAYATRKRLHSSEKDLIARKGASLIEEHDSILLDGSTTTGGMIPYLKDFRHLNVFTNSIQIAQEILDVNPKIKVYMIGGLLHSEHCTSISTDSVDYIRRLNVDKVFIGSCAVSVNRGLSSSEVEDASIKMAMIHAGKDLYIMADYSKFKRESLVEVSPLDPSYTIITDRHIVSEDKALFIELEACVKEIIIAN